MPANHRENKTDNAIEKLVKYLNSHFNFTSVDIQMASKHVKKMFYLIHNQGMQIKTAGMGRQFSEEDVHMANKHMKSWSTPSAIRQTRTKATGRYDITPTRMPRIKKSDTNKC